MNLILFLFVLMIHGAFAGEENCRSFYKAADQDGCDYSVIAHYRQTHFMPDDPLGDYSLIKAFTLRIDEKIFLLKGNKDLREDLKEIYQNESVASRARKLLGLGEISAPLTQDKVADFDMENLKKQVGKSHLPEDVKNDLISNPDKVAITGKINPIITNGVVNMFLQVIAEESALDIPGCLSTGPDLGVEPKWSKKSSPVFGKRWFHPMMVWSKLLIALAQGETNAFMYVGTEPSLREWILAQKDRSVNFENIFRTSYKLNCGDVSKSLMSILNVLSEYFRYPKREYLVQTNKLSPIINHLGNNADVFGPWYHFFGLVNYGYHKSALWGEIPSFIERGTSLFSHEVDDRQENFMRRGLWVGQKLKKAIKDKKYLDINNPDFLKRDNYLRLDEDFSKELTKIYK